MSKKKYLINKFYIGENVYFVSPDSRAIILKGKIKQILTDNYNFDKKLKLCYDIENKKYNYSATVNEKYISLNKEDIKRIFFDYQEEQRIIDRQDLEIKED